MISSLFLVHVWPLACVFLASYLQSLTGFGLAIITAPLLMFFYDAKVVVALVLLLACAGNLIQCVTYFRQADFKLVAFLFLGLLLGEGPGFYIYDTVSSTTLKLIVDVTIIISMALVQISRKKFQERPRNTVITGFFAGIAAITTGMGGPPLMIYLANTKMDLNTLRASCFLFFSASSLTSLAVESIGGYPLSSSFPDFLWLLPGMILGLIVGNLTYAYIPKRRIRQLIFVLLYLVATGGIVQELFF